MKILILGKNGWLGGMIYDYLEKAGHEMSYCHHDINSVQKIDTADVVINCAASTDIDWCEKNKNRAFWNNVLGAVNAAKACKMSGAKYVFISSACIFESKNQEDIKDENSTPSPQCFYARTKWLAEELITEINPDTLIVRPRLPLSEISHPRNTINKLLKYDKIQTNQESVTVVEDFIPKLLDLINENAKGAHNIVNEGTISPAEIADLLGHPHEKVSKENQDDRLAKEGRAKRVTTIIKSVRTQNLPNIRERIISLIKNYGAKKE